jgi:glycosyltransferase involved in cell wall biosynthesis
MSISISFVIPTFNRSKILAGRIEGYLTKLRKIDNLIFEIILANDASSDDTYSVISKLDAENTEITTINLLANQGPGIARNFGLEQAQHEYVWFIDDDDSLTETGLRKIFDLITTSEKDESLIFAHSLLKKYSLSLSEGAARKRLLKNILLFKEKQEVFNFIFNRNFLLKNKVRFTNGVHEDISFLIESLCNASRVKVLDLEIYLKELHEDSITSQMSKNRIDGFLCAYANILNLNDQHQFFETIGIDEFRAQIFGVLCYLIAKNDGVSKINLLSYLIDHLKKGDLVESLPKKFVESDSNFKCAVSTLYQGIVVNLPTEILYTKLEAIFNSHLSCKDLDSSVFLGPNEIRACCKRFFVNGKQKGDVVLLPASPDIDLATIELSKNKLINEINRDESIVCSGCPYIERVQNSQSEHKINYISLENFAYCNMRCTYCSPKYYDGTEAIYGASNIVSELAESNRLSDDCHIVWGGGEPTLSPTFGNITELLLKNIGVGKVRVLSNSLKFSERLSNFLKDSRVHLVTSIDAGKQETFKEIRGKGNIDSVLTHLSRYLNEFEDKSRLTIKYIFTAENFNSEELQGFVEKILHYKLTSPLFQISCDFRVENPDENLIFGFYELVSRLHSIGVKYVFFDDLIRDRLNLTADIADKVVAYLDSKRLPTDRIYSYVNTTKLVLWGRGLQSNWYINNTSYGKAGNIVNQIASYSEIESLDTAAIKVMPSGVQSIYEIIKNIESSPAKDLMICPILL